VSARVTAATRLVAILGDPVAHSLSPLMQNAAFQAAAVDGVYVALQCSASAFPGLLQGIARARGAGNITVPHKLDACRFIEQPTALVQRTGACNTFWLENGHICGDNTDVTGFALMLQRTVRSLSGARVLLLGAGGAARAAACALLDANAGSITVVNRSPQRAVELRDQLDPAGLQLQLLAPDSKLDGESFDLVVNATSLGLHEGDAEPLDLSILRHAGAAIDVVYRPGGTAWIRRARALGVEAHDGLEMLIQQGAAAFERWWDRPAPVDAMRSAIAAIA
jgi:shikimate dehydrogenase